VSDLTHILTAIEQGDPQAAEQLLPLVYEELRKLAAIKMAREKPGQTLQPTALVHEAWLRLTGGQKTAWDGRAHFFAAAAEAMRRILIDHARHKRAERHGGGLERVAFEEVAEIGSAQSEDQILAVNEAVDKLALQNPTFAELVKLRYFVGMTIAEAAEALDISEASAKNYWAYAKVWLYKEMTRE